MPGFLRERIRQTPDAAAILALGRAPLTYACLGQEISSVTQDLNNLGIGRNDRVALILPNGPEAALAFLTIACCSTCAPLNPSYRAGEFEFYFSDLHVKAVILQGDAESPARAAAATCGIPVIDLQPELTAAAGRFRLAGNPVGPARTDGFAQADDIALVLHTSGTTARPKIVPLAHRNLCASAHQIRRTLDLNPADCCLNVMPLFHIHGLIAAVMASLASGGRVVCSPGFNAPLFFEWLAHFKPTWYTAVPTMHQSILSRASSHPPEIESSRLRFIRSSSAALPPQVMRDLEKLFNAPVIEAYGMTEASHQMASNPLPPLPRKPGSVGLGAGPAVAIMDQQGNFLLPGEQGEIVIRGASVMRGYENNPEANASSFTQSWFRTGDQGHLDSEGYLFITGRLKELINRGGEKISPREVDEALMEHPAILQAVAFALPDVKLGEDVAAAVVLKPGASLSEREVREFAASRLADFKAPRRVVILDEIPKGPTGKLQRIGLAEKLGLGFSSAPNTRPEYIAPRTRIEEQLVELWTEVLRVDVIGVQDNFLDIGGDSILASRLISRIRDDFGMDIPIIDFFDKGTPAEMASMIARHREQLTAEELSLQLTEVGGLSDEEAERLLARELQQEEDLNR